MNFYLQVFAQHLDVVVEVCGRLELFGFDVGALHALVALEGPNAFHINFNLRKTKM